MLPALELKLHKEERNGTGDKGWIWLWVPFCTHLHIKAVQHVKDALLSSNILANCHLTYSSGHTFSVKFPFYSQTVLLLFLHPSHFTIITYRSIIFINWWTFPNQRHCLLHPCIPQCLVHCLFHRKYSINIKVTYPNHGSNDWK